MYLHKRDTGNFFLLLFVGVSKAHWITLCYNLRRIIHFMGIFVEIHKPFFNNSTALNLGLDPRGLTHHSSMQNQYELA